MALARGASVNRVSLPPSFNGTPVPWTTPWTGEEGDAFLAREHFTGGRLAICQPEAPGVGRPLFATVHYQRQRMAIIQGLCDVCGRRIQKHEARILMADPQRLKGVAEEGHVMAPSHRECARIAALACPWTKAKIEAGTLTVTVAVRTRVALAQLAPEIVRAEIGRSVAGPVFGHAKLIVDKAMHRDADWLLAGER